jgi:hypothetical protein
MSGSCSGFVVAVLPRGISDGLWGGFMVVVLPRGISGGVAVRVVLGRGIECMHVYKSLLYIIFRKNLSN